MDLKNIKEHPALGRIIKIGMPANRKRKAFVRSTDSKTIYSYWSGGSKDEWSAVKDGKLVDLPPHAGAPGHERPIDFAGVEVELTDGMFLVKGGHFCGKPATPAVYANEATIQTLLN